MYQNQMGQMSDGLVTDQEYLCYYWTWSDIASKWGRGCGR